MTPLRQGYPLENEGCQIPDALGNAASESSHTEVYAYQMFATFVVKIWFQSIHESSPKDIQTYLVRETLQF